jgi:hypothetical protein
MSPTAGNRADGTSLRHHKSFASDHKPESVTIAGNSQRRYQRLTIRNRQMINCNYLRP